MRDLTFTLGVFQLAVIGLLTCLSILVTACRFRRSRAPRWKAQEVTLGLGGPKTRLVPDDDVASIAHQAWAELVTRKAGIQVEDDDVIVEVYDSWHTLFGALRVLAKEVPVSTLQKPSDAKTLLDTLMTTMNEGLRPHLTKHHAAFRHWWDRPSDPATQDMSPQERQRQYPRYQELMSDMRDVNRSLMDTAETLRRLAHERERESLMVRFIRSIRPKPPRDRRSKCPA